MRYVFTICNIKTKRNCYTYPLLCNKYRENGKIKTKVVANLTKFPKDVILAIEGVFKKGKDIMVSLKEITISRSIDYGFVFVLITIMKRLRIDEVI